MGRLSGTIKVLLDLVSYPRSGSNWVKYFVEHMTGLKVGGGVLRKSHSYKGQRQILVVRNYKECLYSHGARSYDDFIRELTKDSQFNPIRKPQPYYLILLQIFDDLKLPKILIYYEDLIENSEGEFSRLFEFLRSIEGISIEGDLKKFLVGIEKHTQSSLDWYNKNVRDAESSGKLIYHSLNLTRRFRLKLDRFLQEHYQILYDKYLMRYSEK